MKTTVPISWIFPLTVFGIGAESIRYLDLVFTTTTRWVLLAGLALFLLSRAKLFLSLRTAIAPAAVAWIGWAALTVLWSDVPGLSLLKVIALAVTVLSLVSGGVYWAQYARPTDPLSFLAPLAVLVLGAALLGLKTYRYVSNGVPLFEGLSENVNGFAILIAVGLAYPLDAAYRAAAAKRWAGTVLCLCFAGALLVFLILTRSRAAMAASGCILLAFAVAALPRKLLLTGLACAVVAVGAVALSPLSPVVVRQASHFLDKGHDDDPYFTRRDVWRISYEHAVSGGLIGLGLGASDNTSGRADDGDSMTTGYGREKGSSQLAIVEETGLIGLAIYVFLQGRLFWVLIPRTIALPDRNAQVSAALATGVLAALLVQSIFEAWWTSPGSLESMVFWATAGVTIGIQRRWRPYAGQASSATAPPPGAGMILAATQ